MRCEIISIGSELLIGKPGKSANIVSRTLASMGIRVNRIVTVGDESEELSGVLKEILERSKIVITIGGLGSTPNDITKEVLAKVLEKDLKFSRKAMENVARYFTSMNMDVPKHCDSQANIFEGAKVLENYKGSSPGQLLELDNKKILILLPGPEEEVKHILNKYLVDFFKDRFERQIRKTVVIHIIGLCESEAADRLKEILETERHLEEGEIEFYFESKLGVVDIIINCWGDNEMLVDEILHKTKREIYAVLEDDIFGEDDDTIEIAAGRLLTKRRKTITVAESCTGGLLSSKITDAPGSSIYFKLSITPYSSEAKIKQLNINPDTIKKYGAVSEEVAREMAENIKGISGADISISVTGYAGPAEGKKVNPGTGYIGLSGKDKTVVEKVVFSGSRKEVKEKFAVSALELLWRHLKGKA